MTAFQKPNGSLNTPTRLDNRLPSSFIQPENNRPVVFDGDEAINLPDSQAAEELAKEVLSLRESIRVGVCKHLFLRIEAVSNSLSQTSVFRFYEEGQAAILRMEMEFQNFVSSIVSAAINESNPHNSLFILEVDRLKINLLKDPRLAFVLPKSIIDRNVLQLEVTKLRSLFIDDLNKSSSMFSESVIERLVILMELKILGRREWLKHNCVALSYCQQRQERTEKIVKIEEENVVLSDDETSENVQPEKSPSRSDAPVASVGRIKQHVEIDRILTLVTFEHYLTQAFETSVENRLIELPKAADVIVAAFPKWIGSSLKIIHGNLVKERQIEEQKMFSENIVRYVQIEDTSVIDRDPAISLGPFVLMGWVDRTQSNARAFAEEEVEQSEAEKVSDEERIGRSYLLGAFFVLAGMISAFLFSQFTFAFGCFATGVAIIALTSSIHINGSERSQL